MMILFVVNQGVAQSTASVKAQEGGKKHQIFNGKNLKGWYTFLKESGKNNDPKKVFTVEDGMIRISGEEWGCITTDKEYENYTLTVEFKWGEKTWAPRADRARDCGVLIHSRGVDGGYGGVWMHSIEVQLIEGGTGDLVFQIPNDNYIHVFICPSAARHQRLTLLKCPRPSGNERRYAIRSERSWVESC